MHSGSHMPMREQWKDDNKEELSQLGHFFPLPKPRDALVGSSVQNDVRAELNARVCAKVISIKR